MTEIRRTDLGLPRKNDVAPLPPPGATPPSPTLPPGAVSPPAAAAGVEGNRLATAGGSALQAPSTAEVPRVAGFAADQEWTFDTRNLTPLPGRFTLVKSLDGDFEVQTRVEAGQAGPRTTGMAVKVNAEGAVVTFDLRGHALTLDGVKLPVPPRGVSRAVRGGGAVRGWGRGYFSIDAAAGDTVSCFAWDDDLDVTGSLAPTRQGLACGRAGAFALAPPTAGAWLGADGEELTDPDAFTESWRVPPERSLWPEPEA